MFPPAAPLIPFDVTGNFEAGTSIYSRRVKEQRERNALHGACVLRCESELQEEKEIRGSACGVWFTGPFTRAQSRLARAHSSVLQFARQEDSHSVSE